MTVAELREIDGYPLHDGNWSLAMTTANDPPLRLQQHAGLPQLDGDVPHDTLAEFILRPSRDGKRPDLRIIVQEIIQCLDLLNRQVNQHAGEVGYRREIDPALVYAVSGMVLMCMEKALVLQRGEPQSTHARDLLTVAWRIQSAWDGLVAGDIDDLRQHLMEEEAVRFGGP